MRSTRRLYAHTASEAAKRNPVTFPYTDPILEIQQLNLHFGGLRVLNDVSLEISSEEILAIIGPNGAGKTSLFNCICGFYHPQRGRIIFQGKDLTKLAPHKIAKMGIARTFQKIELFTGLTTLENLMAARHIHMKRGALACGIFFGPARKEEIEHRIGQLRAQLEKTDSSFDKEKLEERIGKLSGGVAVIRVGAATEVEQKEKQHRIEDAVSATKAAVEEGIVPGGGVALVRAAEALKGHISNMDKDDLARITGAKIVLRGLYAPIRQIAENAGYEGSVVLDKVVNGSNSDYGFNAASGNYTNLYQEGIVDPTKVARSALQNAASVASMFLITEAVVSEIPKKDKNESGGMASGMGDMM